MFGCEKVVHTDAMLVKKWALKGIKTECEQSQCRADAYNKFIDSLDRHKPDEFTGHLDRFSEILKVHQGMEE